MRTPFMSAYSRAAIDACHARGAHAMGGMSALIPIKSDAKANAAALAAVEEDKEREVRSGHDGTWVAHPALVPLATAVFDRHMSGANQVQAVVQPPYVPTAEELCAVPDTAQCTMAGLVRNVDVNLAYVSAWLTGAGCVPVFNAMEDAATAEISRAQLWHWRHHRVTLDEGATVDDRMLVEVVRTRQALMAEEFLVAG